MMEQSQSEAWVAAAQRGDRLALAKLLTTCHPGLRSRAAAGMDAAMKTKGGPDDIVQEVYLDVARQIHQFENRGPGSFLNWVHAILTPGAKSGPTVPTTIRIGICLRISTPSRAPPAGLSGGRKL